MNIYLKFGLLSIVAVFACACGSGTDTEGQQDYESIFVAEEGSTGTISMRVSRSSIEVDEITSFFISARDRNGGPVSSMAISCTAEEGLGVVAPVNGFGLTNDNGDYSGQVACVLPGSWRLLCRAISAAWEEHRTLKCT